jgi:hypothetical protein
MQDTPQATGLLRLAAAARLAGLTPDILRAALRRGDAPLTPVQLGHLTFVKAAELNQWLSSAPAPAPVDLFK